MGSAKEWLQPMDAMCCDDDAQKVVLDSLLLLIQSNPVKISAREGQDAEALLAPLLLTPGTGRLTCKPQFDRVFATARKRVKKEVVILAAPAPIEEGICVGRRLGLVVSRKVGNAVCRNRVKRRLRAIFRLLSPSLGANQDIVVIARPLIRESGYTELQQSVTAALSSMVSRNSGSTPSEGPPCNIECT